LGSDLTGLHGFRPVKDRFNPEFLGTLYHFLGCDIYGSFNRISQFFCFGGRFFFFFCH
jgi:hypothetical protein